MPKECPFTSTRFNQQDLYVVFGRCKEEVCALWIKQGELYTDEGMPCDGMCAIKATALKTKDNRIET
jgi:hypothetical protein